MRGKGIKFADRPVVLRCPPSGTLGQLGGLGGRAVSRPLDRVRKSAQGIGPCLTPGPIWLAVCGCATRPLGPLRPLGRYGPLGRLGAMKPTTAATARFLRDQRFGGSSICWSRCCCPAVFDCRSAFAGFCIGDRFRSGFFWIAEDDLTFGFFCFFTGSASAFVTLLGTHHEGPGDRRQTQGTIKEEARALIAPQTSLAHAPSG
jgi:hypothetical protein